MAKRKLNGLDVEENVKHKKVKQEPNSLRGENEKIQNDGLNAKRNAPVLSGNNAAIKMEQRAAKIEKRKLKREQNAAIVVKESREDKKKSSKIKKHRLRKVLGKSSKDGASIWTVSSTIGGQMIDLEPLFDLKEEHLLVAYASAINVYSTSTSLLVRRLCVNISDRISSFVLSPSSPGQVFISTVSGSIEKWDWNEGIKLEYWYTSISICQLVTSIHDARETWNGLIYSIDKKGGQWMLTVHRLFGGKDASKTDLGTLLSYSDPLTSAKVLGNGKVIVLTSGSRIILGSCDQPNPDSLKDVSYTWRDIDALKWITSIDIRVRQHDTNEYKEEHSTNQSAIDIAVGNSDGCILIYDNLLETLILKPRKKKTGKAGNVSSRRMHWHRNPVLALKWSADGNYLISGGVETTLVIWQLDTTHTQFLPHLSTSIENIVVSPMGSLYCLRLADNSVMILSTSELQPTFNISGIQIPAMKNQGLFLPYAPSVDAPSQDVLPKESLRFPAVVNPLNSGRLLLAVQSSTNSRVASKIRNSACYLQTFDINSIQQMSRQALTRTKATILNEGPEHNTVEEPNVIHMQISYDGRWLATVDEWLPPRRDVALLAFDKNKEVEEQAQRREIYLRIWLWSEITSTWELTFKIHNPHASNDVSDYDSNVVLDLKSDPSRVGFATLGNDCNVRIWMPSPRRRHGREVLDKTGMSLVNWNCRFVCHLEAPSSAKDGQKGARITYSPDGSVLAAGCGLTTPSTIFLVDPSDGTIQRKLAGLYTGPLFGLGILDRYLIILSQELRVWDLVTEEFTFGFALQPCGLSFEKVVTGTHLAIDARQGTFAISLPEKGRNLLNETKAKSRTIIFKPDDPSPQFSASTPNITTALLPAHRQKGYYMIDSAAEIRIVSPKPSVPGLPNQKLEKETPFRSFDNIFGKGDSPTPKEENVPDNNDTEHIDDEPMPEVQLPDMMPHIKDNNIPVVTQDQLAEVFDTGSAFTLPPVSELFKQVASLFIGKPKA